MRRHLIGILALLLWLGAVWFYLRPPEGSAATFQAACWRMGALTTIVWVAYDDIHRMPRWLLGIVLLMMAVVAVKPRLALLSIPLIIALAVLRPKWGRRGKS